MRPSSGTPPARCAIASRCDGWTSRVEQHDVAYGDLQRLTNRFANVLRGLGVGKGDRVFTLAGRIPELYVTALGTLKNRSVFCPLFSAFGPEPIRQRLTRGDGKVLVTTGRLYRQKVAAIRDALPQLEHVVIVDPDAEATDLEGTQGFARLMDDASDAFSIADTDPEDMALAPLHQRDDGHAEGRDPRPRSGRRPLRNRRSSRSTFIPTTSSGAPPTPAGSPAPRTASSRR